MLKSGGVDPERGNGVGAEAACSGAWSRGAAPTTQPLSFGASPNREFAVHASMYGQRLPQAPPEASSGASPSQRFVEARTADPESQSERPKKKRQSGVVDY